jgi:hypothetical protein
MCSFEVEESVRAYDSRYQRARFDYACRCCSTKLSRGQQYAYHFWVSHGGCPKGVRLCLWCDAAFEFFRHEHGHFPTADWLDRAIAQCWEGALRGDAEAAPWRAITAGILRRRRHAQRHPFVAAPVRRRTQSNPPQEVAP